MTEKEKQEVLNMLKTKLVALKNELIKEQAVRSEEYEIAAIAFQGEQEANKNLEQFKDNPLYHLVQ